MSDVKLLAAWEGWCDPCATERPLVLVEIGPRGVKAWLGGVGIEDRTLSLTCRVCGHWQLVPQLEEDDEPVEDVVAETPATVETTVQTVVAEVERDVEPVVSPLLASALIPVRTAAFDESGRAVAATTPAAPAERPGTQVELLDETLAFEPAVEAAPRARWFGRKAAVEAVEETVEDAAPVAEAAPVEIEDEPAAPRARWFSRKAAVEDVEDDDIEDVENVVLAVDVVPAPRSSRWFSRKAATESVEEAVDAAEVVEAPSAAADSPEVVAEVAAQVADEPAGKPRWFTRKTTVVPAVDATDVAALESPVRPAPRSIAPDVEEPVRPHKVNPAAVRPLPQTRAVPVPRTYRSPVRAASATDTAPLALLAAGYDVVAAGAR